MHIGFLTNEYPPLPSGGIGTGVRTLARALVAGGHRATVVGWGHETRFEDGGVRVRMVGGTRVPKLGFWLNRRRAEKELARLVTEEGLDLVEAPDWCGPSAGVSPGCPVVVRCHGSATYFAHLLGEPPPRPSIRWAEGRALAGAASVAAVSRFTAQETRRLFDLPGPVETLYNGIDLTAFSPAPPEAAEPGRVLYLGTVVRKKGILDLARAFSRLADADEQAHLVVVGRDAADRATGRPSTSELAREEMTDHARGRSRWLGPVPHEAVAGELARAAVVALPSRGEALPFAWLETMAAGRPLVAWDIGWAPEVVEHGETGLLIPPGDEEAFARALGELLADPKRRAGMGRAARRRVEERFGAERMVRESLEWYRRVLAGEVRRGR